MSRWDDDDDVPPPVVSTPKSPRASAADWKRSVTAAANATPVATGPRVGDVEGRAGPSFSFQGVEAPDPSQPPPELSAERIKRLAAEAERAAEAVAMRAGRARKVRLRTRVSGWYEGSVPAVDFPDAAQPEHHTFPMAPSESLETSDQYVRYWREPFVTRLRELGFEVIELDL